MNIYAETPDHHLTREQLRTAFKDVDALVLFRQMADPLYYALLDSLEVPLLTETGQRKKERVSLQHNKSKASTAIYNTFVEQAALRQPEGQSKPVVAVITASSRDPFEVADFYISAFENAGAQVMWLPLDKTLQTAWELNAMGFDGCAKLDEIRQQNLSYFRQDIYPARVKRQLAYCHNPDALLKELEKAQAVFFNGGDQSLTLAALKNSDGSDSAVLAQIRQRHAAGELIVGGTSAGTAVQAGGAYAERPVPMLTNGHSELAMQRGAFANLPPSQRCNPANGCGFGLKGQDLTYRAEGGTGLFSLGLLDTHFSERDRETRLAMFTATTGQRFAFGVDETTALLVDQQSVKGKAQFEVLGAHGVFIVERGTGHLAEYQGVQPGIAYQRQLSGISHYLNHGSRAVFDLANQSWQFELSGETRETRKKMSSLDMGQWRDRVRWQCGDKATISWQQFGNHYQLQASENTVFTVNKAHDHCSYANLPFVVAYSRTE